MNFEYTHAEGGPTDPHEVAVIKAGYKWVRTNTVVATRPGEFKPELPIDRLNQHKHSGPNTHLIVEGDISFEMERDPYLEAKFKRRKRPPVTVGGSLDAADPDARKEFPAKAGHRYKATSKTGCSFVEGHLLLSPVTAERFMDRGTLRAIPPLSLDDNAGETLWPHQEEIQDLLRTAKWYPSGVSGLDNDMKPVMMWDDDPVDADADEQYTILRSGRRVPKLQDKGKDGKAADGEKSPSPGGRGRDALDTESTTTQAKKMLAAWFENEWKDYSRNSHREPPYVQYADLHLYDGDKKDAKLIEFDTIQSASGKKGNSDREKSEGIFGMHPMASQSKPHMSMGSVPLEDRGLSQDRPRWNQYSSEYELLPRPKDNGPPTTSQGVDAQEKDHGTGTAWLLEQMSILASAACLVGVIYILIRMENQPLASWPLGILNLNSSIAILVTALKSWAMLVVAACLSQSKWTFFRKRRAPLHQLDVIDEASRGPLGAARLVWSLRCGFRRGHIALLGALITIVMLGIDTFAQQVVTFDSRLDPVDNNGTALFMVTDTYDGGAKAPGAVMTVTDPEVSTIDTSMQGAIYSGLYSSASTSTFHCSSQCEWTTARSLGFASQCNDVTAQAMATKNFTKYSSGTNVQSMMTPGGIKLEYLNAPTSSWAVAVVGAKPLKSHDLNYVTGDMHSPEFVRVAILRLLNTSLPETDFYYLGANVSEVIECTVRFTSYEYSDIHTEGSRLAMGQTKEVPLGKGYRPGKADANATWFAGFNQKVDFPFNDTTTQPEFRIATLDMGALSAFFTSNRFSGSIFDGESPPKNASGMGVAFLKGDIPGVFSNMTRSMTDHLRSGYSSTQGVKGKTLVPVTIVRVNWLWLCLPGGLLFLVALFLGITMWDTRASHGRLWKSSVVAALYHKVGYGEGPAGDVLYTDLRTVKQMKKLANETRLIYS